MRRLLYLGLFIALIDNTYGQSNRVTTLLKSYKLGFVAKGKDSIYYQKIFFNAFPSDFHSFKNTYGYNDLTNKGSILSDVYDGHINHFFALKCINENVFIKKIIDISINGINQADGVGTFENNLVQYVIDHTKEFMKILQTHTNKDIVSVWTFYFDYENSSIRKDNYNKILKLTSINNKTMVPLITAGYEKSTASWKDSH